MLWWLDADMEDYGFEYSDEEPEEQDVDIENQYYNSKGWIFFSFHLRVGWFIRKSETSATESFFLLLHIHIPRWMDTTFLLLPI